MAQQFRAMRIARSRCMGDRLGGRRGFLYRKTRGHPCLRPGKHAANDLRSGSRPAASANKTERVTIGSEEGQNVRNGIAHGV